LAVKKGFGPEFLEAGSRLYRAEYAAVSVVIIAYISWRGLFLGGVSILLTVFWVLFPDLMAFIPIGLASKQGQWPEWGAYLYDAVHNVVSWGVVLVGAWAIFRAPSWPLFGWLLHITVDRTLGYGLRKLPEKL